MFTSEECMDEYCKKGDKFWKSVKIRLGMLLREVRLSKNLSLEEVAAIIGWTPRKLENAENGARRMNWYRYAQLLRFYGKELTLQLVDDKGKS